MVMIYAFANCKVETLLIWMICLLMAKDLGKSKLHVGLASPTSSEPSEVLVLESLPLVRGSPRIMILPSVVTID
jgi:hypothetical protein